MSGTFPSTPAPRSFSLSSVQPTRLSVAHSLKRNARTTNAQRWRMRLSFASLERADLDPVIAFIEQQRGRYDTFQFVLPNPLDTPRGVGAAGSPNPFVNCNLVSPTGDVQTGRTILSSGWPASVTALEAGDFLKFGSHSKAYRATAAASSSTLGVATLQINPAVVQALSHGDAISTHSIPFMVCLADDEASIEVTPGPVFRIDDLEFLEVY